MWCHEILDKGYDMKRIMTTLVDEGSFFEIGKDWGASIIGGLARLDGVAVAIYAENPMMYGGGWTADSCRKLTRLIDLASMFKLPMIHLEDCPGFLIGKESERARPFGMAPRCWWLSRVRMPYCTVVGRRFGVACGTESPGVNPFRWRGPPGDLGSLPLEEASKSHTKPRLSK